MNRELEAALAASRARRAERAAAPPPAPRARRRVSAPKTGEEVVVVPKTEVAIVYPKRVVLPTWECNCPRKHDITPLTVTIICFRCNTKHEVRKSRFDKGDA